jgi:hypothetical protein
VAGGSTEILIRVAGPIPAKAKPLRLNSGIPSSRKGGGCWRRLARTPPRFANGNCVEHDVKYVIPRGGNT